jgi:hypothetical protein
MVVKRKKKDNDDLPDNKIELGAFAIQNWWKIAIIIAIAGLAITGFSLKCGNNEIVKDPVYQRVDSKSK